jgi:uncharacterized protein (DUF302 family)
MTTETRTIALRRHEFRSSKPFDDVLTAVRSGLGRPDFAALTAELAACEDWDRYRRMVGGQAGSSGLMIFLELDLGDVVRRDPDTSPARAVRIIAGNPVTMESMVRTTPGAGAFAPVTILLFERDGFTVLRYDTIVSAVGDEWTDQARSVGEHLDRDVLDLLDSAAHSTV